MSLLDGKTVRYTYEGGWSFRVRFEDGLVSYDFLGDDGEVSASNSDIPYSARELRSNLYHTYWHEADIGDVVSLVIDFDAMTLYSAALLDYPNEPTPHFESAVIEEVLDSRG